MTSLPMCCQDLEMSIEELLFPERLDAQGRYFVNVHGIDSLTLAELQATSTQLENGRIRIAHRCSKLLDSGCCGIYERRPLVCREFDCKTRSDCDCKGSGRLCNSAS